MAVTIIACSLLAMAAVMIARAAGVDDLTGGAWPVVGYVPIVGLPIATVLIVALVVVTLVRRAASGRG